MKRIGTSMLQFLMASALTFSPLALADVFTIDWSTIDGGGQMWSSGGAFELGATIGQPDAGVMSGGVFALEGGFWPGAAVSPPCPGDLNSDAVVDLNDLVILLGNYGDTGASPSQGDLNGDTNVDLADLSILLSHYGDVCG